MPDVTDVKEVTEMVDMFEVNKLLSEGWILIGTHPNNGVTEYQVIYVLGKP